MQWNPPAETGGQPVNAYRITQVETGNATIVNGSTLRTRVSGLLNGSPASFTVQAHTSAGWGIPSPTSPRVFPTRPNIVLVLTDDQRSDTLDQLPLTMKWGWRNFTEAVVPEPQCCPARASLLTGRLPSTTGVDTLLRGKLLDESRTVATFLNHAGYRTIYFGKYLNGYPFGTRAYNPPGWEVFQAYVGKYGYYDYRLAGGSRSLAFGRDESDYSTDKIGELAIDAARRAAPSRPLFMMLAPIAPHSPLEPAPRHTNACADRSFALPPNFNASDTVSEPNWLSVEPVKLKTNMLVNLRKTCAMLAAVDEMVDGLLRELLRQNRLANTYFVFTSDNGFHFGEHRLTSKGDLYEESIRVPLIVRGPGIARGTSQRLTSNIDLVPTFTEWARTRAPSDFFDGHSFAEEARGEADPGPQSVLLRGCRTTPKPDGTSGPCGGSTAAFGMNWGVRTARWKYVVYTDGYEQLFDLASDPYEMTNLALAPASAPTLAALRAELVALGGGGPPTIP